MAKFKSGDAVKLRDDAAVNANVPHSTRFVVQEIDEIRRCLLDCGYWIFEDALEAWPESTEETMSNEKRPLACTFLNEYGICLSDDDGWNSSLFAAMERYAEAYAQYALELSAQSAKETLRLLREEQKTK